MAVFTLALDHPPGERTPQNDDFHIHKAATLPDSVYRLLVPVLDARFFCFLFDAALRQRAHVSSNDLGNALGR